jgi:hypothetical protein
METKYLRFIMWVGEYAPGRKTHTFNVESKSSRAILGLIKWYGPWRQYCFYPEGKTIFNVTCMGDISNFIRQLMEERKEKRPNAAS